MSIIFQQISNGIIPCIIILIAPSYPVLGFIDNQVPMTPLKQIRDGVLPPDVVCKAGFELVIRMLVDSPACVEPNHVSRFITQGWWIWNDKVGAQKISDYDKRSFGPNCPILPPSISIVGSNGFVSSNLPDNKTYTGYEKLRMFEFVLKPDSTGYLFVTYDFNSSPDNPCNFTWKDGLASYSVNYTTAFSPIHLYTVNDTGFTFIGSEKKNGFEVEVSNETALNDHTIIVVYKIISPPENGSYLIGFHFNCRGTLLTVGDSLHQRSFQWESKGILC